MPKNKPILIGVTGGSGSGKTSVSRAIFNHFPDHSIMMVEQDSYYKDQSNLSFEERLGTNYDHPFAFDTDLLIEHLQKLQNYEAIDSPFMIMWLIREVLLRFAKNPKKSSF